MKCSKCNNKVNEGDKYCNYCGNNLGVSQNNVLAIISILFGVGSLLFGVIFIPISIIGLIVGLCQRDKSPLKTIGIVLNSIGLFIAVIIWTLIIVVLFNISNITFNNDSIRDLLQRFVNGVKYDDTWDEYSALREGALGKEKTLEGSWKILDDSSGYIVFRDGKVYLYSDMNNLEDNYWYGTYKNIDDEEATELFDKIDIDFNYFIIEVNITKGIFDGKENNNMNGTKVYGVSLIDHDEEGIEARIYGEDNSVKHYVKMSD